SYAQRAESSSQIGTTSASGLYTLLFFFYVSARQLPSRMWHPTRCEKSRSRSPSDLPEPTPGKQSDVCLEPKQDAVHIAAVPLALALRKVKLGAGAPRGH